MSSSSSRSTAVSNRIVGGIWPFWFANERPPSSIPASCYTHVIYAFVNPDLRANFTVKLTSEDKKWMPELTRHLHSNNPSVKVFLGTGGAGDEAKEAMSAMACQKNNRKNFIQSIIQVARKYSYDGVNLGWEFPNGESGMKDLASLLTELREAIDQEARQTGKRKLGMSISVYFAPDLGLMSDSCSRYPAETIASKVDFVNVMCYDYAGNWDTSRTGSIAALNNKSGDKYCTSYGIQEWIKAGVPSTKLVMGLPLYGRTWKLRDQNNNGIGAPAVGIGPQDDDYTEAYMVYSNVVIFNSKHGATERYDPETVSYYSHAGTNWISYDGERSIEAKVRYARENALVDITSLRLDKTTRTD
ncbi:hypothetical protein MKW92_015862 [Papaver armeniacum]|nr:hypothetical protein MKW92_015862 [Papaver armeniacum]